MEHEKHNQHKIVYIDALKQKLTAKSQQLKQYIVCNKRKQPNKLFEEITL